MNSTIILVILALGIMLVAPLIWALCLRFGLWWAKVPDVTIRKIALTYVILFFFQLAMIPFLEIPRTSGPQMRILLIADFVVSIVIPIVVIAKIFKLQGGRAIKAWLPTLTTVAVALTFNFLVMRPFLFEGYTSPANNTAPTLIGSHWKGVCPQCGGPNYGRAYELFHGRPNQMPTSMICDKFHVTIVADVNNQVFQADRFLVAKFLTPRRWDIVVFEKPEDPEMIKLGAAKQQLHVMRLIGLPGEKIEIKDGAVWANDEKLTLPEELRGIIYESKSDFDRTELWGTSGRPAQLGADE